MPLICNRENIERSISVVLRGSKRKNTGIFKYIYKDKEKYITKIIDSIENKTFRLGTYTQLTIKEGIKERDIQIIAYKDRIVVNVIMEVVDQALIKRLIFTTASSIKDRGPHYLKKIIQRDLRNNRNLKYFYKIDINKYYQSIDQGLMRKCIRHYIKDKDVLFFLDMFINMLPQGLSIGLRSSQIFGNLFLNWILDTKLKNFYKVKYYYRYCDDIVILSDSKRTLWKVHSIIIELLNGTKLTIKKNYRVSPISNGIDFLGFVIFSGIYCRVRKRIKIKAKNTLLHIRSYRRRTEIIASIKGYCLHSNGHNLFNTLINTYNNGVCRKQGYSKHTIYKPCS